MLPQPCSGEENTRQNVNRLSLIKAYLGEFGLWLCDLGVLFCGFFGWEFLVKDFYCAFVLGPPRPRPLLFFY